MSLHKLEDAYKEILKTGGFFCLDLESEGAKLANEEYVMVLAVKKADPSSYIFLSSHSSEGEGWGWHEQNPDWQYQFIPSAHTLFKPCWKRFEPEPEELFWKVEWEPANMYYASILVDPKLEYL